MKEQSATMTMTTKVNKALCPVQQWPSRAEPLKNVFNILIKAFALFLFLEIRIQLRDPCVTICIP